MFCELIILSLLPLSVLQIQRTQQCLCLHSLPVSTAAVTRGYTWSSVATSSRILCSASRVAAKSTPTSRKKTQTVASAERLCWLRWPIGAQQVVPATGESWIIPPSPLFKQSKHMFDSGTKWHEWQELQCLKIIQKTKLFLVWKKKHETGCCKVHRSRKYGHIRERAYIFFLSLDNLSRNVR